MSKLSIIIPFGTNKERPFIEERVIKKANELKHSDIEVIFVEGYSSYSKLNIQKIIENNGHKYIKNTKQTEYSSGECRNIGVQYASSQVITFLDVDCYISEKTLSKIFEIIEIKDIATNPNMFFVLPCAYLTENGTNYLNNCEKKRWDTIVQYDIISKKNNIVKFLSLCSSTIVMNKHKFLELGGNDLSFEGHGYEDFDFYYRLFKASAKIDVMPENIEYDSRSWNFINYKGFRAMMSVPGYEAAFYGIYMYHFWHPEPNNNGYLDNIEKNHQKFYNRIKKYFILSDGPDTLQISSAINNYNLAFVPENSSVYRSLRGITPYIGKIICCNESNFFNNNEFDRKRFDNYIYKNNIINVLFPNPYGNEKRLVIYKYVRENKIPYICYDRGALPDSWFFDTKGFNYDSDSYLEKNWNNKLNDEQYNEVISYINSIKESNNFLESQGEQIGEQALRQKLGIRYKKVIFIPLQVETDTVIKYFTREPFSYYNFLEISDRIADKLEKEDWVIIVKKHPLMLNIDKNKYKKLKFVPDNTNIIDLIKCSDIIMTINSGVGLYAMIFEKPCLIAGNAFYSFSGINYNIFSEKDILNLVLNEKLIVDKYKMYRFIYFLYKKFYSYGKSYYTLVNENNRKRNVVNYIDFYKIILNNKIYLNGNDANNFIYKKDLLAVRPYAFEINNKAKKIVKKSYISNQSTTSEKVQNKYKLNNNKIYYKKIKKLFNNPKLFFIDLIKNKFIK